MTGWDAITADMIRDELAGFTEDSGISAEDGWYALDELTVKLGIDRHPLAKWLKPRIASGEVEVGERPDRAVDGRRIRRKVYRLVRAAEDCGAHDAEG